MASMKALMPRLAPLLATTPTSLYERQRVLVGADLLAQMEGKGPGSGVHETSRALAILLISMMATDSPAEAPERTYRFITLRPTTGECSLTGGSNLVDSISALLDNAELRNKVIDLKISRTSDFALLRYKPHGKSAFGEPTAQQDRMDVSATLSGNQLKRIHILVLLTRRADLRKKSSKDTSAASSRPARRDRRES